MNEKVSVVIPMYNVSERISICLQSILDQTYQNIEVVCVDDGSSDDTYKICSELAKKDKRIRIFRQSNKGASAARNYGMDKMNGDFFMFVDADDYIESDMIEDMLKEMQEYSADFLLTGMYIDCYDKKGDFHKDKFELEERLITENDNVAEQMADLFLNEKINGPCCKLYRSCTVKEYDIHMPEKIVLLEDLSFNIQVLKKVKRIKISKKVFYHYVRGKTESVTTRYYENRYEMMNAIHNEMVEFFQERTVKEDILNKIKCLYIKIFFSATINFFNPNCKLKKKEKANMIQQMISCEEFDKKLHSCKVKGAKIRFLYFVMACKNKYVLMGISYLFYHMREKGIAKW